jgi:dTMP kinase
MFVSLEGLDGVGKSTQARLLAERLRAAGHEVVECREPGGTPLGERVRTLVLDHGDWDVTPRAEALLFAASRAQLVADVIAPALDRGAWVICDRYIDSSVAYQGFARGLGEDRVRDLNLMVTNGLLPDRTFLVLLDPEEARSRGAGDPDRIEREGDAFWRRADEGFRALAAEFPERIVALDGTGSPDEIAKGVREHVRALL